MLVFLAFVEWDLLTFGLLQKKFSHLARGALGLLAPWQCFMEIWMAQFGWILDIG